MLAWFISESDSCCWWDAAWLTMHSPGAHILLKEAKLNSIPQQNLRVLYNALTHENSLPTSSLNSLLCLLYCKHFLSLPPKSNISGFVNNLGYVYISGLFTTKTLSSTHYPNCGFRKKQRRESKAMSFILWLNCLTTYSCH